MLSGFSLGDADSVSSAVSACGAGEGGGGGSAPCQLTSEEASQDRFEVDANAVEHTFSDLGGPLYDILQQLSVVALAEHGDTIHLRQGLSHILGNLGQGLHDHFNHGGIALLLHGLSLFQKDFLAFFLLLSPG